MHYTSVTDHRHYQFVYVLSRHSNVVTPLIAELLVMQ